MVSITYFVRFPSRISLTLLLLVIAGTRSASVDEPSTSSSSSSTVSSTVSISNGPPPDPFVLPNPPLAPNPFADDNFLTIDSARETVALAGILVYKIFSEAEALQKLPSKYTLHTFKDTGSTEVLILSTETTTDESGKILVLFRGTDNTEDGDWLTNFLIPKVPFGPPGKELHATTMVETLDWYNGEKKNSTISLKVHKGFNQVFSGDLYEHVLEVLQSERLLGRSTAGDADEGSIMMYYNNTVHFIGHSLGGANAQLMGTYFAHFHPEVRTHVTSLGAPRQGNLAFKVLVESLPNLSTWRMVFCNDIVPRIPNVRYYHAGHLMYYDCHDGELETPVGAYYRHAGDSTQGYAGVTIKKWNVSPVVRGALVSDHLGAAYLKWLDSVTSSLNGNWTSTFEREKVMMKDDADRKLKRGEIEVNRDYHQVLGELKIVEGYPQALRGFPVPKS